MGANPQLRIGRHGRLGPLVLALVALALAFWAQSLIRQPQIVDSLVLFGAALALLILATRGMADDLSGEPTELLAPDEEAPAVKAACAGAPRSAAGDPFADTFGAAAEPGPPEGETMAHPANGQSLLDPRWLPGAAFLLAGLAFNVWALALFPSKPPTTLAPWLIFFPSLALSLTGFWLLGRASGGRPRVVASPRARRAPEARSGALAFVVRYRTALLLGLIVALAAFMRLFRLDALPAGLFYDEAMWGLDAQYVLAGGDYPVYFPANYGHGPLYIYLLAVFVDFLGPSAVTLRLLSALIGILTIPAMFLFVRLLLGTRTALLAAFLLAVSRWHINFSRVAFDAILVPLLAILMFYFLVRALRTRRTMDFVWAGVMAAVGLNTYVAFRLLPFVAAFYVVHKLVSLRKVERRMLAGIGALVLAGLLVASPYVEFYFQNPEVANQRVDTVNVFAGRSLTEGVQAALESTRKHLLMFNQQGDHNGRHNLPGEPMLDPITGALFVLGLGYSVTRARRPEFALLLLTFVVMLSAGILTLDFEAPQALRAIGTLPIAILFASMALDWLSRLTAGLGRFIPRAVLAISVVVVGYAGVLNYMNYFGRQATSYASWNDFSMGETLAAAEMKTLGADWQIYVTSLYHDHPTLRFLAPKVEGYRRIEGTDFLPLQERGDRNVAIFLDPQKSTLFAQAKRFYPNAFFKEHTPPFGGPPGLLEIRLRQSDLDGVQGLMARYAAGHDAAAAPAIERREGPLRFDWASQAPLPAPFDVEWQGTLNVPSFGSYLFGIRSPGPVSVWLDENEVLNAAGEEVTLRLAKGNHSLRVRASVPGGVGITELYWQPPRQTRANVPLSALYAPPVSNNGLLASYYSNLAWSGEPAFQQIDPSLAIYFHNTLLPRPYTVEWRGKVLATMAGDYAFGLESIDEALLEIDGRRVVESRVPNRFEEGRLALSPGWHDLRLRYVDKSGWSHINLFWTPPGRGREIIPSEFLLPPQGSYPAGAAVWPAQQQAPAKPPAAVAPAERESLLLNLGASGDPAGRLSQPKDLAVAEEGSVFVADSGNGRIARFDGAGRFRGQVGRPGDGPGELRSPNAIAIAPDGDLVVLDGETKYISRFAPDGTFRGRFGGPDAGFYNPRGIAVAQDGTIYLADTGMARVVAFAPDGAKLRELGGKGSAPGQLLGPVGVVVDVEGKLWVADVDNNRVQRLAPDGQYLGSFAIPPGETVDGAHLALGANGLYVSDSPRDRILIYSFDGTLLGQWGQAGSGDGQLKRPIGIVVDPAGNVWVAERDNHRVQEFRPPR